MATVVAAPYAKNEFDDIKTKAVVRSCVARGHLSVLEHVNISLKCLTNIETYKDYTRHRHCAFTIEYTSFVKYKDVLPVILVTDDAIPDHVTVALEAAHYAYNAAPTKVGRDYLPQCTAANMIMTTNIREWRHIIGLRGDPNDNPLTIELRDMIWTTLNNHYPFFFPRNDVLMLEAESDPMTIYDGWGKHKVSVIYHAF
jgi:thymidylate synthase (FAD)